MQDLNAEIIQSLASGVIAVDRDGKNIRQITKDGNNFTPNWSQ